MSEVIVVIPPEEVVTVVRTQNNTPTIVTNGNTVNYYYEGQGEQGEPGEPGPEGPQGPIGPQGIQGVPGAGGGSDIDDSTPSTTKVYSSQKTQDELDLKVDKEGGKGLSQEDYSSLEKTKLGSIEDGAEVNVQSDWSVSDNLSDAFIKNKPTIPTALSTTDDLTEGSTNLYFTAARAIASVDISGKVDKVTGKGLSTEDYTTAEKSKLSGIETGAQVNDASTTLAGNTFNGNSQLVQLTAAGKYPALDGSLITNLAGGLPSMTGNSGKYLTNNGTVSSWATASLTPAGATAEIQFNNSGVFGSDSRFKFVSGKIDLGNNVNSSRSQIYSRDIGTSDGLVFLTGGGTKSMYLQDTGELQLAGNMAFQTGYGLTLFGTKSNYIDFQRGSSGLIRFSFSTNTTKEYLIGYRGANKVLYFDGQASDCSFYFANTISGIPSNSSAIFEIASSAKGFLIPRMTTTNWNAISSKAEGLLGWDNADHAQLWYDGTRTIGFRFNGTKFQGFDGSSWVDLN